MFGSTRAECAGSRSCAIWLQEPPLYRLSETCFLPVWLQEGQAITAAAFVPHRAVLAIMTCPAAVRLYDVHTCALAAGVKHASCEVPQQLRDPPGGICSLAFNPDSKV